MTPDTAFLIGSVSKPITATIVGRLVNEGVLAWDEPVWPHLAHLADQPAAGFETATVEQLITHTAGLRMSVGVAGAVEVHGGPDALDRRARDLLSKPLGLSPGTGWEYSNAGPTLLAAVIEQVTGRSFSDKLRDRIFDPLGMTGSFATAAAAAEAPMATGHALWFGRWRGVDHPYDEAGAAMGYIGSTARDLAAFMQAHFDGHPAIPADAHQLTAGPIHATGWDVPLEAGYGRGWFVDEFAGHTVVSHTGSLGHFTAHILLVPTTDLGIAVLTNASAIIAAGHTGQYDLGIRRAAQRHRDAPDHEPLAIPLMLEGTGGLVVEVGDGKRDVPYRTNMPYDLVKTAVVRIGEALAHELQPYDVTALTVTPGWLRSESMLDYFGVTEETWREAADRVPFFSHSETPHLLGRGIAALAADPDRDRFAYQCLGSWDLMRVYDLVDADGTRPDWGAVDLEARRETLTNGMPESA